MIRYWTQFAKSGDPNSSSIPFWRQYDPTTDEFQSLVPPSPMVEFQFAGDHKCDFWAYLLGANAGRRRESFGPAVGALLAALLIHLVEEVRDLRFLLIRHYIDNNLLKNER